MPVTTRGKRKAAAPPKAAASPAKRKPKKAKAVVTPPAKKKKGLSGHAAVTTTSNPTPGVIDSGLAGIDKALASRATLHSTLHAKLALIDPSKNSDKYYILQTLIDDSSYHVYKRWGRTGTSGQAALEGPFTDEETAQASFEKVFKSKTGVAWDNATPGVPPTTGKYEYLAIIAANASELSDGTWYYYLQQDPLGKTNGWYPYDAVNTKEVEGLYGEFVASNKSPRLSRRVVTSESSGFQYQVDLVALQQTNIQSGTQRPIGRTTNGKAPTHIPCTVAGGTTSTPAAKSPKKCNNTAKRVPVVTPTKKSRSPSTAAVDDAASSNLKQNGSVDSAFNVMLNQTNLGANNNKFYKIQLIELSTGGYVLFTKWGRVGESGKTQEQGPWTDHDVAVKEFAKKFRSKTANSWQDYQEDKDSFAAKKGKYTVLEMEQDEDAAQAQASASASSPSKSATVVKRKPCELDTTTKKLVDLIFNQDMFQSAMKDLNLDPQKLPLGALSQAQIAKGFIVLEQLEDELNQHGTSRSEQLTDLTSKFYTIIPHAFGRSRGPVLNTLQLVQDKYDMLNTLADIETAQAMQKQKEPDETTEQPHLSDLNYQQLQSDLTLVDDKDPMYKCIQEYFENTRYKGGGYCNGGNMTLSDVWEVNRHGESKRFAQHNGLDNRKLLWHGTSVAVVAAILKSGLRIMPHSGGRVGRGIYLADQHQKSAWYVRGAQGKIIMFLVEAALGKSHEILRDDSSLTAAPPGFDSVLAKGRTAPKGETNMTMEQKPLAVPNGKVGPVAAAKQSSFDHNEFLIYKESQHRIRYILMFDN